MEDHHRISRVTDTLKRCYRKCQALNFSISPGPSLSTTATHLKGIVKFSICSWNYRLPYASFQSLSLHHN